MNPGEKIQSAMKYAFENRPSRGGFPFLAECLRQAGVISNHWTLPAAQSVYVMDTDAVVNQGSPLIAGMVVMAPFNEVSLIAAIRIDQAGESTFSEFLEAIWQAGVVGYDIDFNKRIVTYRGIQGEIYTESYPMVEVPSLSFE